ncbi:MAG: flavin reductase family protein [Ruminococcus sp.]|nr:flavin reductase family protein [Ruminococcus sp.]
MSGFTEYTKESWKGSVMTAPVPPVLVTCGTLEEPNVLTVAWTGTLCTQPPVTYISLRRERYSYDIIKSRGEFVINLPTAELVRAVDFCGVRSGRNTDKLKATGLTLGEAFELSAPLIVQSPVNLECRVREIIPLGTHDMFIADIVKTDAAKELLDDKGRLALERAQLLAYSHGEYFALGKRLGSFGFSVKKTKKKNNSKGKK